MVQQILVVHGDFETRLRLCRVLSGQALVFARSADEAATLLRRHSFDGAIADRSGLGLAAKARAEGLDVPFILLVPLDDFADVRAAALELSSVSVLAETWHDPSVLTNALNGIFDRAEPWVPGTGL